MQISSMCYLLAVLVTVASSTAAIAKPSNVDERISAIEATYHVQVHYRYNPTTFIPKAWWEPSLKVKAKPLHPKDVDALVTTVERFLVAHPNSVIKNNLKHIYLLGQLSFKGREYGGTHISKSIYVIYDHSRTHGDTFMLERFHSEFSGILMCYHPFPEQEWKQQNSDGFQYTGTGFEMLGDPNRYESDETIRAAGFLCKYSQSSMENDFNMISAMLFTDAAKLEKLAGQHDSIRKKLELAKGFYQALSAGYGFK